MAIIKHKLLQILIKINLSIFGVFIFASCAGTAGFSGIVFKGPVQNAQIMLHALNSDGTKGSFIETTKTDSEGVFSFTTDVSKNPQIYVEVTSGQFIDEATGKLVTISEKTPLKSLISNVSADTENQIIITPFTTLMSSLSQTLTEKDKDNNQPITTAKKAIGDFFGIKDLNAIWPVDLTDDIPDSVDNDATLYSLIIAGLSQESTTLATTHNDTSISVMTLIDALSQDISDGIFDGKKRVDGSQVTIVLGDKQTPLSSNAMKADLVNAISDFLKNARNKSGVQDTDTSVINLKNRLTNNSLNLVVNSTLQYEGFLYDLVAKNESLSNGDGKDAVFLLTLNQENMPAITISDLKIKKSNTSILWDTTPNNQVYALGVSEETNQNLLNQSDSSINLSVSGKKSFYLYVNDFSKYIEDGGDFELQITLASGLSFTIPLSLKPSLLIPSNTTLTGVQSTYSFIGVFGGAELKAGGSVPLELFSEGHILVEGVISANGQNGKDGEAEAGDGGIGGPGASPLGDSKAGQGGEGSGKKGKGDGAGKNKGDQAGGGGGGYGTAGENGTSATGDNTSGSGGPIYGTALLNPLVGGSGGAGGDKYGKGKGGGGGGGAGAIRLEAQKNITVSGTILANGGNGGLGSTGSDGKQGTGGGGGSGGGIFLKSQTGTVTLKTGSVVQAVGGNGGNLGGKGGQGRVRIE